MNQPHVVDIPHRLGQEEARRRIARGVGRIADHVPGGAQAESSWDGDRLNLKVTAMGQAVTARMEVMEAVVRVEIMLPAALSFFAKPIEAMLKKKGTELLEDRR
ncbi:MAG TPA: polyhydroxyalkanoic acid system family protein [Allosphingosinicella sp.]|jgi:hypothetical protein|nr:polyhydroxyalkanoic acid system family protein [Allosphingosinicella sp.]